MKKVFGMELLAVPNSCVELSLWEGQQVCSSCHALSFLDYSEALPCALNLITGTPIQAIHASTCYLSDGLLMAYDANTVWSC
jgi:hypothetical protein